jgi:hypothetical protein
MKGIPLRIHALTALGACLCALVPAHAAKPARKAPPKKAAPVKKVAPVKKPAPAKPAGNIVLGTKQLPGDFGKFGTTYTIGKDSPINFTLRSAEYRVDRFSIDSNSWGQEAGQKLLVLHFTVQNPTKSELNYYWGGISFTAVDSQDVNHEYVQAVTREGDPKRAAVNMSLKPAQKIDVVTAIVLPAEGVAPKLIVQREDGAAVVRYDLRGKVTPLAAPFADPADASGATALARVPARPGVSYPLGNFDATLDAVAFTANALNGEIPEEGMRYLTATFTIKNATMATQSYYWGAFEPSLKDADGETVEYNQVMLKASRDEAARGELEPGDEARIRFFFAVPTDLGVKSLWLKEGDSRTYTFDISNTQ